MSIFAGYTATNRIRRPHAPTRRNFGTISMRPKTISAPPDARFANVAYRNQVGTIASKNPDL